MGGKFAMSERIASEVISRRRALSFLGLAALALGVPATVLRVSEAQQPTPEARGQTGAPTAVAQTGEPTTVGQSAGMERRQARRAGRRERRAGRRERRQERRTGRRERRQERRSPGAT
jgi:hypothetical protein